MSDMPTVEAAAAINGNWIADINRFNLPKPPEWFLKILWDQDPGLVLLPSRQVEKYILARRRERSRLIADVVLKLDDHKHKRVVFSDGDMLESRKLVRVDAITSLTGNLFNASWFTSTPELMKSLRERDMWAVGGAEKYVEKLEAAEAADAARKRQTMIDNIDHRARDAYRSYQARSGQRNQRASSGPKAKIVHVGTLPSASSSTCFVADR